MDRGKRGDRGGMTQQMGACPCNKAQVQWVNRLIEVDLARRGVVAGLSAGVLAMLLPGLGKAQTAPAPTATAKPVVLTNFRLFDGKSSRLRDGLSLTVDGNRIGSLTQGRPATGDGTTVIDCHGMVLMPGLIDMHWHSLLAALPVQTILQSDMAFVYLAAAAEAERTLLRGFTTVRDAGGPAFALQQAIDNGLISGPRIYPSGAMITTTGGHGDFRPFTDLPRTSGSVSQIEKDGAAAIADTEEEIRLRVREQFIRGASQVKIVGSGGVSSPRSPLDMLTFTERQMRAGVETANDWGSYAMVHAYTPAAIQRSLAAGVQCIEHGHLMDDATASQMAKRNVWLSTQPFLSQDDVAPLSGVGLIRFQEIIAGTDNAIKLAKKHGIKTAFGTDLIFSATVATRQGAMLANMGRWYSNAEVLSMVTSGNAALLALSGKRNPYPAGLGTIAPGAYADLLLVDGNPLDDLTLLADPGAHLKLVMKDGKVFKNQV